MHPLAPAPACARPGVAPQPVAGSTPVTPGEPRADDWWCTGVVYQIYPRSFADHDGDGVGDLRGIISHLDHLRGTPGSLGVDALWLSPIYPSPGRDLGYDVSDHEAIDPLFGTLADFDRLVEEAHRRGLRVILDLVMNHTSDEHPWFVESCAGRDGPYADYYIWRDPNGTTRRGRPRPPNNWVSCFGGSAWAWEPRRGQFYLHTFLPQQPDLNWRNPQVRAAQFGMVRGWLARGVDGFRLDVFNAFLKHPDLRSNPRRPSGRRPWDRQLHVYDKDQPELDELLAEFRAILDEQPGWMSVGELFEGDPALAARYWAPRHLVFDFRLLEQPWSAAAFAQAIDEREAAFGPDRWPTVVLSNHDNSRHVSRYAGAADPEAVDAIARASALILLTLRGTPFLYYGEEIGMPDIRVPGAEALDPPARRRGFGWWNRDQARAPMPWTGDPGSGFTSGRPWLPLPRDAARRNVADQIGDPSSVLGFYRRLLAARRLSPAIREGLLHRFDPGDPDVLSFVRSAPGQDALVVVNFTSDGATARIATGRPGVRWRPLVGTHDPPKQVVVDGGTLRLRPLEGVLFVTF